MKRYVKCSQPLGKSLTYSAFEELRDTIIREIEASCNGQAWDSYDNILVFRMPRVGTGLKLTAALVKGTSEDLGYRSYYANKSLSPASGITNCVVIEDPNDIYKYISITVNNDTQNSEKGYRFQAIEFVYAE